MMSEGGHRIGAGETRVKVGLDRVGRDDQARCDLLDGFSDDFLIP